MNSIYLFVAAGILTVALVAYVATKEVQNLLRAQREDEEKNGKTWGPHPD